MAVGDYKEPEVWPDDTLCAIIGYQAPVSYTDILASTSADKGMVKLRTLVIAGFPNTNAELQKDLQQYWRVRDMLSERGGVIYLGDRVVVPEMFRERILNTLHAAHQGTTPRNPRIYIPACLLPLLPSQWP